jgi:Uma2 family endonuclease
MMAASERDLVRRMTISEFERLPESDEFQYELSRGVLVREPRPGRPHGTAVMLMGKYLVDYALEHGGVVTTETGFVLEEGPDTLRGPDVAYMRADPAPYGKPAGFIRGAPDLAVEVISPANTWVDIQEKVQQYFGAGCRLVWIVQPKTRSVLVHSSPDESRTLREHDTLDGADVLPGFALPVADLFRF